MPRTVPSFERRLVAPLVHVVALGCASGSVSKTAAAPVSPTALECTFSASGETRTIRVEPTKDPYGVKELPIGGRFALKVVYVREPADVAGVRIYAYQLTDGAPRLLQEAKYRLPFTPGAPHGRNELSGLQLLYEPELDRELSYRCDWIRP